MKVPFPPPMQRRKVDETSAFLDYSIWKSSGGLCENGVSSFIFALLPTVNFADMSGMQRLTLVKRINYGS
jgi:hypothetical protein